MTKKICEECEYYHVRRNGEEYCKNKITLSMILEYADGKREAVAKLNPPGPACRDFKWRKKESKT